MVTGYYFTVRVVWISNEKSVQNSENLTGPTNGQADFENRPYLRLVNENYQEAAILLDFGKEIQGGY